MKIVLPKIVLQRLEPNAIEKCALLEKCAAGAGALESQGESAKLAAASVGRTPALQQATTQTNGV